MEKFQDSFRTQWLNCAKPFGLERIQVRNAGQIVRLRETARRIGEYLSGKIAGIAELEGRTSNEIPNTCYLYGHVAFDATVIGDHP